MVVDIGGNVVNVIMADDMPVGVPEHVWKNPDDSYTMKLNAKYSQEALQEAFKHASDHIMNDDWKAEDVQKIEAEAHHITPEQTSQELPDWVLEMIISMAARICTLEFMQEMQRDKENEWALERLEDRWLYDF